MPCARGWGLVGGAALLAAVLAAAPPSPARADHATAPANAASAIPPPRPVAVPPQPAPSPLRAALEMAGFLGAGAVWYWLDRDRNLADWDFPSWEQRVTLEAWRYDNNEFPINFLAHPVDGGAWYAVARANDLGPVASLGYAFATSFVWEYLLEFREKVSINDMLTTPFGGLPIGEFAFKLGELLRRAPAATSPWHSLARWTAGLPRALHDALDAPLPAADARASGDRGPHLEGPPPLHRLWLAYGGARIDAGRGAAWAHQLSFGGRIADLPGYERPGRSSRFFYRLDIADLTVTGTLGTTGAALELDAETWLAGYHAQELHVGRRAAGRSVTVGTTVGYAYLFARFDEWRDRQAALHLPGLAAEASWRRGDLEARASVRLSADFAGTHSYAHPAWQAAHPGVRGKSVLRKHGYYYGWGYTASADADVRAGPLTLSTGASWHALQSADGLDRTQEELDADPTARDTRATAHLGVRVALAPRGPLLGARYEATARDSWLDGVTRASTRTGAYLSVTLPLP